MIELYTFAPNFGIRCPGPYALKLETYLALAGFEYNSNYFTDPRKAPKGKVPYIKDGDTIIGDSALVIKYLKEKYPNKTLGKNLSAEQHAQGHLLATAISERDGWVLMHSRWAIPEHHALLADRFFSAIPAFMRGFVVKKVTKDVIASIHAQGMGRHTTAEIYAFGVSDIKAVETTLGNKPFLFGDEPCEYDATAFGMFRNFAAPVFKTPMLDAIQNSKTLTAYLDRVEARAFGNS